MDNQTNPDQPIAPENLLILDVRILTPRQIIYQGQALSVSSVNSVGQFDILPQHANFITLIENQTIQIRQTDNQERTFQFNQAIIFTTKNQVNIYAEPYLN